MSAEKTIAEAEQVISELFASYKAQPEAVYGPFGPNGQAARLDANGLTQIDDDGNDICALPISCVDRFLESA